MDENRPQTLNDKVREAIEEILVEMAPKPDDINERPSDDEAFEKEQKRYIRD